MSKLIIMSEGDMERAIDEMVKLSHLEGDKTTTLVFPSPEFWLVFKESLHGALSADNIPKPVNIDAEILFL